MNVTVDGRGAKALKVSVEVTPEHARHGKKCHNQECALALALRAAGGGRVSVSHRAIGFDYDGQRWAGAIPTDLTQALVAWDLHDEHGLLVRTWDLETTEVRP